jgi:3-oxoacyl-[acyl-carrier-protein] synthase II
VSGAAITGFGLHGAFGDLAASWRALQEGRSGVQAYSLPDSPGLPQVAAAPAAPIDLSAFLTDPKLQKYMGPATELAVLAAGRALSDAGALGDPKLREATALFVTTDLIAFALRDVMPAVLTALREGHGIDHGWLGADGFRGCHPLMPFKMLLNMPLGMVSIVFGLRGDNFINYPNAQQSAVCLEAAVRGLASGRFSRALVGASAHPLCLSPMLRALRGEEVAWVPARADPAGPSHQGLAPADAAAFVQVESAEEARRRGAEVLALLSAVASSGPDAFVGVDELEGGLEAIVHEAATGGAVEWVVATGLRSRAETLACARAVRQRWPDGAPALVSFDGRLGYGGAAALVGAMALGSRLLSGAAPAGTLIAGDPPQGRARGVLVLSRDGEGALAAALLAASSEALQ